MAKAVERVLTNALHQQRIRRALDANTLRRAHAGCELVAAREELIELVLDGKKRGLGPREIAKHARINRVRVQEILRGDRPMPRLYEGEYGTAS